MIFRDSSVLTSTLILANAEWSFWHNSVESKYSGEYQQQPAGLFERCPSRQLLLPRNNCPHDLSYSSSEWRHSWLLRPSPKGNELSIFAIETPCRYRHTDRQHMSVSLLEILCCSGHTRRVFIIIFCHTNNRCASMSISSKPSSIVFDIPSHHSVGDHSSPFNAPLHLN
jgi:hypothetical protein